jgi:hypothetical protein
MRLKQRSLGISRSTFALLAWKQTHHYEANADNTLYTSVIKDGRTENARLIALQAHEAGEVGHMYYVWIGEEDTADDIAAEWLPVLWGKLPDGLHPDNWDPIFRHDNKPLEWAKPLTLSSGDVIEHVLSHSSHVSQSE